MVADLATILSSTDRALVVFYWEILEWLQIYCKKYLHFA